MSVNNAPTCDPADHPNHLTDEVPIPEDAFEKTAAIFSALGDVNRLRIVMMLSKQEMCVSEITTRLNDNISAVSQRLKLLRFERIVRTRRAGKHIYYRLADQHIKALIYNALEHATEI